MTDGGFVPARLPVEEVLVAAQSVLRWPGVVLPKVVISSSNVFSVVSWTEGGRQRVRDGVGPVTDRPTLAKWEEEGPPPPLRIVGFIYDGPAVQGIDQLKGLAAYGAGAIVVRSARRLGCLTMAEADIAGISVVELAGDSGVSVALHGRSGSIATRRSVGIRLREEQLFAIALHQGFRPTSPFDVVSAGCDCASC